MLSRLPNEGGDVGQNHARHADSSRSAVTARNRAVDASGVEGLQSARTVNFHINRHPVSQGTRPYRPVRLGRVGPKSTYSGKHRSTTIPLRRTPKLSQNDYPFQNQPTHVCLGTPRSRPCVGGHTGIACYTRHVYSSPPNYDVVPKDDLELIKILV